MAFDKARAAADECDQPLMVMRVKDGIRAVFYVPLTEPRYGHDFYRSCAGLIRASIEKKEILSGVMDCRVKPGNDGGELCDMNHIIASA
ncbi:hypothetical protein [Pseudorhodoplanes sp.]|uniref:hypothetical protein n=1 Tax=Pseudorhodoplanes sp. TaxID=1934341 RepID=UPI00391DDEF6